MSIVLSERAPTRGVVRALVLDSPLLDWPATLAYASGRHRTPTGITTLVTQSVLTARFNVNLDRYNSRQLASALSTPTLLVQGAADTVVPPTIADQFAESRPDLVTYLRVPGADHVSAIDAEPAAYTIALRHLLAPLP